MSPRANKIGESLSARNRQVFAALAGEILNAFESGRTIKELCQEYGLPEQRVRDILKDEKTRSRLRH
jgi:DNA-directed RNA polymerase sigma subunit (sigma70/sigma32)